MKALAIFLFVLFLVEAYLVVDARKERNFFQDNLLSMRDNYINRDIIAIKVNIKVAEEIVTNPANALNIVNQGVCGNNPFPDMYLNTETVSKETKDKMLALKEEVAAHCKAKYY